MDCGKQQTTTRSPDTILKSPKAINPSSSRITPPIIAERGKSISLINWLHIFEVGLTTNSSNSASILLNLVIATTSPLLMYLKILLAAKSFLFIKVQNPFSDNDFRLTRSPLLKNPWYNMVDNWRKGKIADQY